MGSFYRFDWIAWRRDGTEVRRFNADGTENRPDPWRTCQFHLIGGDEVVTPVSFYVPKGARFVYQLRNRADDFVYIAGWERGDEGFYVFCLPDGRIEIASSLDHNPRL